jgi:quercetin 2,3-dioxygenase
VSESFVMRAEERGYNKLRSTGPLSSYVSGHPEAVLTRHSSFNFGPYQAGRHGFGRMRVFGDEVFSGPGCGYNMHRHHNFIICAFVFQGELTHINTVGNIDRLTSGDYYVFSAGSGGKHCEVNLRNDDMHAIYMWFLPDQLYLPPSYHRNHFDALANRNQLVTLVGNADGALRLSQDVTVSRLSSDTAVTVDYTPRSDQHGVYVFVLEGEVQFDDVTLGRRDSRGLWKARDLKFRTGPQESDLLIVETAP